MSTFRNAIFSLVVMGTMGFGVSQLVAAPVSPDGSTARKCGDPACEYQCPGADGGTTIAGECVCC